MSRGISYAVLLSSRHLFTLNHDLQDTKDDKEFLAKLLKYVKLVFDTRNWNALSQGVPIPIHLPTRVAQPFLNEICLQNMSGGMNFYITGCYGTCLRLDMNSCYPNTLRFNVPWKIVNTLCWPLRGSVGGDVCPICQKNDCVRHVAIKKICSHHLDVHSSTF